MSQTLSEVLRKYRGVFALAGLFIILSFLTEGTFLTPRNLSNLTRQVAINGILAIGMTFVILVRGIDLSVGSVVALAGVVSASFQISAGFSGFIAANPVLGSLICIVLATLVGLACGLFNAILITRYQIAPFIISLGLMVIARGLALILSDGAAIAPLNETFNNLGNGYISPELSVVVIGVPILALTISLFRRSIPAALLLLLSGAGLITVFCQYYGLPYPVLIFGILTLLGVVILEKTRLGRFVIAIGGNPEAAWISGVPVRKITFGIYASLGALAGLSGAILSARLNGALPTAGELFELDAIAAVVIGGTSLQGGIGTVHGSVLGAFFIGALNNGMSLLNITEFYQKVIKGVIIILAVWFDTRGQSKR